MISHTGAVAAADLTSQRGRRLRAGLFGFLGLFRGNLPGAIGAITIVIFVVLAVMAPIVAPFDPSSQDLRNTLQPPSLVHLAGTDEFGRDVFSRLLHGARTTLLIVLGVSVLVAPLGLMVGVVSGYFGGWTDRILMRVVDIFLSFPSLVLALALVAALGAGLQNAVLAIALTGWPSIARLARAETLSIRSSDYIAAARLYGARPFRILWRHVVPLCMPSVLVRLTLNMAGVILTAAGLGFLGLGAQPPMAEWGTMISSGRKVMLDHWWVATFPGLAILITSLSFNLVGDTLRDALDPRLGK